MAAGTDNAECLRERVLLPHAASVEVADSASGVLVVQAGCRPLSRE